MPFCPNCGAQNTVGVKFCTNCGNPLQAQEQPAPQPSYNAYSQPAPAEQTPQYTGYSQPYAGAQSAYNAQDSYNAPNYQSQPAQPMQYVPPVETGGLLAWSIITLLLCTIPGIVAISQTSKVNKCYTVEEQQKKLSSAKTWCIIGTVLGALSLIGYIAGNLG